MEEVNFNNLMDNYISNEIRNTHINIGTGEEISIKDLASLIKEIVGFKGELFFNSTKPEGTMRKVTDCSKIHALGWKHKISLREGIEKMYSELKGFDHSSGGSKRNIIQVKI
jgi:GDP-L-fucose synthase